MDFLREKFGQKFDPFRIYEVPEECVTLQVTVIAGRNITKGALSDFIDTPDPYVELEILNNPCGIKKTEPKINNVNPVWNKTFTFVLDPKQDNILGIKVQDKDIVTSDDTVYSTQYEVKKFPVGKTCREILKFNKVSEIELEFLKTKKKETDFRHGWDLCPQELEFIKVRKQKIMQTMQSRFGEETGPKVTEEVPNIAILGSGGGFRAMCSHSGVFKGLKDTGILDYVLFSAALSGSAWYQAQLYSYPDCSESTIESLEESLFVNITKHKSFIRYMLRPDTLIRNSKNVLQKKKKGQPATFTDNVGWSMEETFLENRGDVTLSGQRASLNNAVLPLPLYCALSVKKDVPETVFNDYVEFTPFEVGIPKYGVSIPVELYGNRFYMGKVIEKFDEVPLSYLMDHSPDPRPVKFSNVALNIHVQRKFEIEQHCKKFTDFNNICVDKEATWGSCYTVCLARLVADEGKVELSVEKQENNDTGADELPGIDTDLEELKAEWKKEVEKIESQECTTKGTPDEKKRSSCGSEKDKIEKDVKFEKNNKEILQVETQRKTLSIGELIMQNVLESDFFNTKAKLAACVHNIMHGIQPKKVYPYKTIVNKSGEYGEIFEAQQPDTFLQYVIDAGTFMNSPYPLVLRPQRAVDIILSFDFSARKQERQGIFKELKIAETWAKVHRIPFPEIDEEEVMKNGPKECYLFENKKDPNCPIILHFALCNEDFRLNKEPGVKRETAEEFEFGNYNLFEDSKDAFASLNTTYDRTKFDRLTKLMTFNVDNNAHVILDTIKRTIERKRTELNRVEWNPVDSVREAGNKLGGKLQNVGKDMNKLVDGLFTKALDEEKDYN